MNTCPKSTQSESHVDLYLIKSPRQWWVAHGLSQQLKRPCVMVVNEGFKGANVLNQINNQIESSLLVESLLIPGKITGQDKGWLSAFFERKTQWIRAKSKLTKLLHRHDICRVVTANLNSIPAQFLHSKLPKSEFHVVDDGLETYQNKKTKTKRFYSILYASILSGFRVRSPSVNKILPFYTEGWFITPDNINSRFQSLKKKNRINIDIFNTKQMLEIANKATSSFQLDFTQWRKQKIIFVLSRSDFLKKNFRTFKPDIFREKIQSILNEKVIFGKEIWVKYHPRESDYRCFNLEKLYPDLKVLPTTLPFEILSPGLLEGDIVIGEISTALFDVAQNSKGVKVYSLCCLEENNKLKDLFYSVGINIL